MAFMRHLYDTDMGRIYVQKATEQGRGNKDKDAEL